MTRALVIALLLSACSSAPSSVRVQIALGDDAAAASKGPASLDLYTSHGRVLHDVVLKGGLPGDVVILVDDDAGEVSAVVRAVIVGGATAAGYAQAAIVRAGETRIRVTLGLAALADRDGDGVPDEIDDCPDIADEMQVGSCVVPDQAALTDGSAPPDLTPMLCGNGTLDPGEACDTAAANSDDPTIAASCTTGCQKRAPCAATTGSSGVRIDPSTGHCYVAWPGPLSYTAAERDCLTRGGHLAAITTAAENDLVKALTTTTASWIGLVAPAAGVPLVWTTGESSIYMAFRTGEPTRGAESCVVSLPAGAGWEDRVCGWPAVGNLVPSTASTAAYVCEQSCGNGTIDPGEACDPPGATCTSTCRTIKPCTEAGGMSSPATGSCYFQGTTVTDYATALASGCPAGTHLATPTGPFESETAVKAINADSWIAVRAPTTPGVFLFDRPGPVLDTTRYHGFASPDPDSATAPVCAAMTHLDARGDGWRDRDCAALMYTPLCERD